MSSGNRNIIFRLNVRCWIWNCLSLLFTCLMISQWRHEFSVMWFHLFMNIQHTLTVSSMFKTLLLSYLREWSLDKAHKFFSISFFQVFCSIQTVFGDYLALNLKTKLNTYTASSNIKIFLSVFSSLTLFMAQSQKLVSLFSCWKGASWKYQLLPFIINSKLFRFVVFL